MATLREDQNTALERLRESIGGGRRRIMLQASTGWGKTVLAGEVVRRALAKSGRVLFTVPAITLIDQTVQSLQAQGIEDIGVIQAQHEMSNWDMPVQVASVQTLMRHTIPDATVVMIDEAHRWFAFYGDWMLGKPPHEAWRNKLFVGLSATPWTKGLGKYFEELIIAGTTQQCIDAGTLSPFKVFAPAHPDLSGVRTVAGDYHEGELAAAMSQEVLVADVVKTWLKLAEGRPTLCFAVDCAHAQHLQQRFTEAGVPCGYQDAHTRDAERAMIKARFHSGELKVVCNVGTLTTGVDWDVRCLILARPTKSEILFVQMVGRALRIADGKDHALILDHSDNHLRLGFVTDIHHDTLHDGLSPLTRKTDGIRLPKECPECAYLKPPGTAVCPNCGFTAKKSNGVAEVDGELQEIKPAAKRAKEKGITVTDLVKSEGMVAIYAGLLWVVHERGYKTGWASNKFKELFGQWPDGLHPKPQPHPPSRDLRSWLKSRQIAWAKGKPPPNKLLEKVATDYIKAGQQVPAGLGERIPGTLCTEQDFSDFGR